MFSSDKSMPLVLWEAQFESLSQGCAEIDYVRFLGFSYALWLVGVIGHEAWRAVQAMPDIRGFSQVV